MYSSDSPSAGRPNHHQDFLTAAADEAAGYVSRSPHSSPSQSPRRMAAVGRTRSKLDPDRPASQQPYAAAEPKVQKRTPSSQRSRISWLMCTDWASALTVWGSDVRFRTTVLVNLTVRYTLVQPPSVAGHQGMLHSGRRFLYEKKACSWDMPPGAVSH